MEVSAMVGRPSERKPILVILLLIIFGEHGILGAPLKDAC